MIKRREFLHNLAVLAGGALVAAPSVRAQSRPVRIGVLAPSHCALPILLAKIEGLFDRFGLRAEIVYAQGMPEIVKGLCTGDLTFGQLITPVLFAVNSGTPEFPEIKLQATQVLGTNGGVLAVSARTDIQKLSDLKGKTIGVHSRFLVHSLILDMILEKYGLDRAHNISVKVLPMSEMGKALQEDRIQALINPEPLPTFLEEQGLCKTLLLTRMFWLDHPCCLLASPPSVYLKEQNLVRDVTLACTLAGLTLDSPAFRAESIAKVHAEVPLYRNIDLARLQSAFAPRRSDFYPLLFQSAGLVVAKAMRRKGTLGQKTNPEELVRRVFKSDVSLKVLQEAVQEVPGAFSPNDVYRQEQIRVIKLG